MISRTATTTAAAGALAVVLVACGDTGTESRSTQPPTTRTVTVTDVDAADYAMPDAPGHYWWTYGSGRVCTSAPAAYGLGRAIYCSVTFPPGSPQVRNDIFTGPPTTIRLTAQGTEATISEGGRPGASALGADHRITIDDLSCTVLADGNDITCTGPGGGFTFADDVLIRTGTQIPPTTPNR